MTDPELFESCTSGARVLVSLLAYLYHQKCREVVIYAYAQRHFSTFVHKIA